MFKGDKRRVIHYELHLHTYIYFYDRSCSVKDSVCRFKSYEEFGKILCFRNMISLQRERLLLPSLVRGQRGYVTVKFEKDSFTLILFVDLYTG